MSLVEVTAVIALILALVGIAVFGVTSYSEHKDQQVMTAMLREVYTAQLKVVNNDPEGVQLAMNSGTPALARAYVAGELIPRGAGQTATNAQLSTLLRDNYKYVKSNTSYSVYVHSDLRLPPYWALSTQVHSATPPTAFDPSGNNRDGKYDLGNTAGVSSGMPSS